MNTYFATCPRGLEELLADDLTACGGMQVRPVAGGVAASGSLEFAYRVNLESRIATRLLHRIASADYRGEADIYKLAYDINWHQLFSVDRSIRVYVTAIRSPLKSLEFITLKVKDAVCDRFRAETSRRPSVNTKNPEVRIHLFLTDRTATLYLDTSGEPLYLRGHKLAKVGAPLKENLAAGILCLSGWQPGTPLLDPMCGSGTFLLEAAQMTLNDAPGLSREQGGFGFEHHKTFDAGLWRSLQRQAAERRCMVEGPLAIFGSDQDVDAVSRSRQNLAHAGLDGLVVLEKSDLLHRTAPAASGVLVANPPYGERLGSASALAAFYPLLGNALKQHFAGWHCWFLSADTQLPKRIRLQTSRKIPLYNGALECRLYGFDMVAGSARRNVSAQDKKES
ncbi:DNA methylase [Rugosibacter aromaticivorans]|uniref:DNA methylase n=1 Tax=Rugosibacter aromaticivorans TaxID=1565605 RepID=A0A0C5J278_9PROT|nr:THUMP domain-containing protein [Rugosibacter aromaticivorans]AJP49142.1 DNA methylase [Rugosibacter aromaticivorans]TBR15507.1 MAG: class I SAM-dependent RNA methyltransferase [Rugosibacter sp.]